MLLHVRSLQNGGLERADALGRDTDARAREDARTSGVALVYPFAAAAPLGTRAHESPTMKSSQLATTATNCGLDGRSDNSARPGGLPETVRFALDPSKEFLVAAEKEHQKCLDSRDEEGSPTHLPSTAGLLFGRVVGDEISIEHIEFVPNVRDTDNRVIAEFESSIAPQFGEVFKNPGRGFWCDDRGVLQAIKRHAASGRSLMGSIHSHPNWHEIGPRHERRHELSENPTQMDEYIFRESGWPVNVIWYVRASDTGMTHRVAAWRPGADQYCDRLEVRLPSAFCDEFEVQSRPQREGVADV